MRPRARGCRRWPKRWPRRSAFRPKPPSAPPRRPGAPWRCPCWRARASARIWRELPLWFPEGEELVEGVVDLVFEEEGELVVVDYKTDSIAPQQALAQAAHHAPQLQLYGRGLVQATGMKLRERVVLFTTTGQAVLV